MNSNKKILVVGGGTAGWMSAALLNKQLNQHGFEIALVESPDIGIIGVGEGSTPQLKTFFDALGIAESEWMNACNATFKNGIRFTDWTKTKRYNSYFHPFPSMTDRETAKAFLVNCHHHRNGNAAQAHPDDYFLAALLAAEGKSPKVKAGLQQLPLNYAYHFDSALMGNFIREHAVKNGVEHRQATIKQVGLASNGDIEFVETESGEKLSADIFIDCTGFRSLLVQDALNEPFVSFNENLFNDAAIALPSPALENPIAQTTATALSNGWAWHIPLKHRTGNGYVFSTQYCSFDDAEKELRQHIGLEDADIESRQIRMKVGRCRNTWVRNCVAVGLSQGFIEPLEATALHIVQETIQNFIGAFSAGQFSDMHRDQYNSVINGRIDGIRDYIVCHYQASDRTDTQYWQDNTNNRVRSESLAALLDIWVRGGDITAEINKQNIGQYYPAVSWHCLLAGYEAFPALPEKPQTANQDPIQQHLNKLSALFVQHKDALLN